ncbi:methyltransferase domain-containing protein [Sphingomonas sp. JC676]|uniref:class I SAM-dependent methyltransferase n=1 Tax=Sphingomonas sp. JC676 TaxID=2768065 RepID=UPI0016576B20|nr:methyltransferase domain-containing protein [Sphingomonas sp. JC676]MBC9033492.1 methyltransferase domain-containing protein [Sphingomonas sp. JC676]
MDQATPFDGMAVDYDRTFTTSAIGRHLRAAVWRRFDAAFQPGERILELNCGTGEDAIHLGGRGVHVLATDISETMLDVARARVERAGLTGMVDLARVAIEELPLSAPRWFDGAISNFGGLNCVDDLPAVARGLAEMLRTGAPALLCVMGPAVPWEWGWYLAHGQPRKALRRLRRGGTRWRGLTIRYPSIGAVRRAFAPYFAERRVAAIGALVPPSYAEAWAMRHPRVLATLDRWERRVETFPPLPSLADHYLIELERKP